MAKKKKKNKVPSKKWEKYTIKNNKIEILIDIDESLANAIRRSVNEILIPATDEVTIFKNDSGT